MGEQKGEMAKFPVMFDKPGNGVCCAWVAADVKHLVVVTASQCIVTHLSYNQLDREVLCQGQPVQVVPLPRRQ